MPLILEQSFPLGRFHATRWNQNPFEDRHGEWPPSPWRLLRALAARWFQYARETGDEDKTVRDELLEKLAAQPPVFQVPASTWRGEPVPRQYHKTEVAWTDAAKKAAAYRKPKTTLAIDAFRAISPEDRVVWLWKSIELSPRQTLLLGELLKRILYFGRAETQCRFSVSAAVRPDFDRCELSPSNKTDAPVLIATPGAKLNFESLLASSDDKHLSGRSIPLGTEWRYAHLPPVPRVHHASLRSAKLPDDLHVIQFAVGGRVFPELSQWVRVIERFRGCVLKHAAQIVSERKCKSYGELPPDLRDRLKLLSGKDGHGTPLQNHAHAYYFLCPDEIGNPTRLVVWRRTAFEGMEVEALLAASEEPIFWHRKDPAWSLRLVPLPFKTPPPHGCSQTGAASAVWISATPFVLPNRHRFRENGRLRPAETAVALLRKALSETLRANESSATIVDVQTLDRDNRPLKTQPDQDPSEFTWITIHENASERKRREKERARRVRPGFRFRVTFSEPIRGPLLTGHSCHFGMGLFVPECGG